MAEQNTTSKFEKFLEAIHDNGDMYFYVPGQERAALVQIEGVIALQGFWSGLKLRYYFDKDFNLLRTEERVFGL